MCMAMITGILYRVCQPVHLIVYANRYTLSCMSTGIPYRVCPPVYLIVFAHRHTLSSYRVGPLVSPKCKESSFQRRHL